MQLVHINSPCNALSLWCTIMNHGCVQFTCHFYVDMCSSMTKHILFNVAAWEWSRARVLATCGVMTWKPFPQYWQIFLTKGIQCGYFMFVIVSCDCSWLSVRGRLLAEQSRCWFETSWTSCDVSIMTLLISKYNAVLDSTSILGMLDSVLVTRHLHGNDYRRDHGNDHKINQHHFPLFWLTSKVHHCF